MLTPDILGEIFKYLDDRDEILNSPTDFRNLYTCLLVNNQWCNSAIPVLWRTPFSRCYKRRGNLLIKTLINCLNLTERQDLYNDGVFVPSGKYNLPLFNYSCFIKNLDYFQLITLIKNWCRFYLEGSNEESVTAILRSVLKLLVKRRVHLNTLIIRSDDDLYYLLTEPQILPILDPIRELQISCSFPKERLMNNLAKHCRNIISLKIMNLSIENDKSYNAAKKLALLIENQRSLKSVFISRTKFINIIIPSLIRQKKSLRKIIFRALDFKDYDRFNVIKSCSKLEKLDLVDCYNLNSHMITHLINHKNLKRAGIRNCSPANVGDELKSWADKINCRRRKYY
ncbi:11237_t:CDS:2 [Diversispora eburnea]|uniref:11237_t:CDS:1 n=1 Tax=Diversispora eburnea TaxID=1213867 RepID=A0A9N9G0L8_9GLOM|nr:11237_t:CDS:2 [Diversispora eburnea]